MKSTPMKKWKRAELVNKIKGKYSHLKVSSKDLQEPKRVVLGTGTLYWEDSGLLAFPVSGPVEDFHIGRKLQKKYVGKKIRLIAEII